MVSTKATVKVQGEKVDQTGEKFAEIARGLETSKELINTVGQKSSKVQEETVEVTNVIQNLSAIAEENAATTQQASASVQTRTQSIHDMSEASENLAQIADGLQSEVSKIKKNKKIVKPKAIRTKNLN